MNHKFYFLNRDNSIAFLLGRRIGLVKVRLYFCAFFATKCCVREKNEFVHSELEQIYYTPSI